MAQKYPTYLQFGNMSKISQLVFFNALLSYLLLIMLRLSHSLVIKLLIVTAVMIQGLHFLPCKLNFLKCFTHIIWVCKHSDFKFEGKQNFCKYIQYSLKLLYFQSQTSHPPTHRSSQMMQPKPCEYFKVFVSLNIFITLKRTC